MKRNNSIYAYMLIYTLQIYFVKWENKTLGSHRVSWFGEISRSTRFSRYWSTYSHLLQYSLGEYASIRLCKYFVLINVNMQTSAGHHKVWSDAYDTTPLPPWQLTATSEIVFVSVNFFTSVVNASIYSVSIFFFLERLLHCVSLSWIISIFQGGWGLSK